MTLAEALKLAVEALASVGGEGGAPRQLTAAALEVAVLEPGPVGPGYFRRLTGAALTSLLPAVSEKDSAAKDDTSKDGTSRRTVRQRSRTSTDQPAAEA